MINMKQSGVIICMSREEVGIWMVVDDLDVKGIGEVVGGKRPRKIC